MRERCAVLDWAASGAMALTGVPDGAPVASPAPALAMLGQVTAELARATGETGHAVRADPAELITGRAALRAVARGTPAEDLAAAAQLVGVPAAALPASGPPSAPAEPAPGESPSWPPWRTERIAAPLAGARLAGAVVADLSSMWAGPL